MSAILDRPTTIIYPEMDEASRRSRFILVDWGTSRFRAFLINGETIVERVSSEEGVSALRQGQHREVFLKHCRPWLEREPAAPVALVGMVGSREGWVMAPYAQCPAGA